MKCEVESGNMTGAGWMPLPDGKEFMFYFEQGTYNRAMILNRKAVKEDGFGRLFLKQIETVRAEAARAIARGEKQDHVQEQPQSDALSKGGSSPD